MVFSRFDNELMTLGVSKNEIVGIKMTFHWEVYDEFWNYKRVFRKKHFIRIY